MAINVQQLITGYGIGFSAPCLAQLVSGTIILSSKIAGEYDFVWNVSVYMCMWFTKTLKQKGWNNEDGIAYSEE